MRYNTTLETYEHALLRLAIRDACYGYETAANAEEAEAMITLEDMRTNILQQLERTHKEKEKEFVTPEFIKTELKRNNLVETLFTTADGTKEIWFLKKKPER